MILGSEPTEVQGLLRLIVRNLYTSPDRVRQHSAGVQVATQHDRLHIENQRDFRVTQIPIIENSGKCSKIEVMKIGKPSRIRQEVTQAKRAAIRVAQPRSWKFE